MGCAARRRPRRKQPRTLVLPLLWRTAPRAGARSHASGARRAHAHAAAAAPAHGVATHRFHANAGQLAPARCEDPLESDGLASLDAGAGDDGGGLRITATDQDAPSGGS